MLDDQAIYQSAELQKSVPIAPITGQARGLQSEHSACGAGADRGQQALEAGTRRTPSGAAKVIVDDDCGFPAERLCAGRKAVLTPAALGIVDQLIGSRLSNVDIGAT
ncbi:hypothetical protein CQ13_39730 [Bradyrhizobium retamae]|uniref:Uncharacterized protein n=1 Tax=Bradyrhizobium retamae TaxID=1300035 RepID=A0A0R3N5X5_9BRAD|nr:hypothetical protein CQ13_39730 [Bradyrhizobium retamae]